MLGKEEQQQQQQQASRLLHECCISKAVLQPDGDACCNAEVRYQDRQEGVHIETTLLVVAGQLHV